MLKILLNLLKTNAKNNKGFSLVEILIALVLVVGVFATVFSNIMQSYDKGKLNTAKISISSLVGALDMFELDCGSYPSSEEGLEALVIAPVRCESWGPKPYLKNGKIPKDPWKNNFIYKYDQSTAVFEIISLGKGGQIGGKDLNADISSKDL